MSNGLKQISLPAVVLIVSLAHGMCHVYETVFPAVQMAAAAAWSLDEETIGLIVNLWALPFGLGAVGAGWLADAYGSRRWLIVYLVGCAAMCGAVWLATDVALLKTALFASGCFASLYHPAGLAYLARVVPKHQLGWALSLHGMLGSAGLAVGPVFAGALLLTADWQQVFLALAPIGLALAAYAFVRLPNDRPAAPPADEAPPPAPEPASWGAFVLLCVAMMLFGLIYRGFITFLPPYLAVVAEVLPSGLPATSVGPWMMGAVLLMGVVGQYLGGMLTLRFRAERLLLTAAVLQVPMLL
ncbi:MAG: MFS transporter, partial [Planctomycetia bacterium]